MKPGSSAGDHYASVLFKIIVTYESKGKIVSGKRFIMKTLPEKDSEKRAALEGMPIFENEIRMNSETLPAMEKILRKSGEKSWWPR